MLSCKKSHSLSTAKNYVWILLTRGIFSAWYLSIHIYDRMVSQSMSIAWKVYRQACTGYPVCTYINYWWGDRQVPTSALHCGLVCCLVYIMVVYRPSGLPFLSSFLPHRLTPLRYLPMTMKLKMASYKPIILFSLCKHVLY